MTKQYKTVNQPLNAEGLLSLKGKGIQFFSEPPAPTPDPGGTPPVPETPEPVATPPAGTEPPATPETTFSQADVNAIASKEAKTAQEKMLKQLGIEDFDSAKEGMKKFQEWQESQKTEQQLKDEKLQELETNFSSTSDENTVLKAQISAMKVGVKADSVSDVVTLAKTMVTEEVDMDAAIASVVEKYPHFAQVAEPEPDPNTPPKPQFSNGQHQTQPATDADKWMEAFKM